MVNLLVEAMFNSMALYVVFNKGEVEDAIKDQLILSLNEIIQKKIMLKDQLASHYSIWLEICVELLLRLYRRCLFFI
jgi:hypothetical protein